jgi:hypothetical protein
MCFMQKHRKIDKMELISRVIQSNKVIQNFYKSNVYFVENLIEERIHHLIHNGHLFIHTNSKNVTIILLNY